MRVMSAKTSFTSAKSGQHYSSIFQDKSKDSERDSDEHENHKRKTNLRPNVSALSIDSLSRYIPIVPVPVYKTSTLPRVITM